MGARWIALLLLGLAGAGCVTGGQPGVPQVFVQLNDGQVVAGALDTSAFTLKTQLGALEFAAEDAGEIGPLEGGDLQESGSLIRLWLRDGSEFVGDWQKPIVRVTLEVGGAQVPVDVPIQKLARLRFRGQAVGLERPAFRVLTHSGDDFYVDAEQSRVRLKGEMGTLEPFLAEIVSLERRSPGKNDWRLVLKNGCVLHAAVEPDGVDLRPMLGPERIQVAWSEVQRLELASTAPLAQAVQGLDGSYFDNGAQRLHKQSEASSWR
ncbi:MAG TPA: hypothetical protein PK668_01150 [Myxococcota bacterium]|nr:hypothetical protein [Myxococcota bacterium]HRY96708.1 hypothetical protein [Myxococcota bacterium]HSA20204.1 hypothetical protein [Myxococcota bacterium]